MIVPLSLIAAWLLAPVLAEAALPRGKWILGSSNSILAGTPVENVMAMYDARGH